MYYLFGKGENVYIRAENDEKWTSKEKEKEKATLILEELPLPIEHIEGKDRILFVDPETLEISWFYRDIVVFEEVEE